MNSMNPTDMPSIVNCLINYPDLDKLAPLKTTKVWLDQFKALVNLIPGIGGGLAQEIEAIQNYKEAAFFRKLTKYVLEISDISFEERTKFSEEIENTAHDYSGCVLLDMIDRLDNINKQIILANLTKARINSDISIEDYFRLSSILERIPYVDFQFLPSYANANYDESGDTELLYATGVLQIAVIDANGNNKYILSELGRKLLQYGMMINTEVKHGKGVEVALNTISEEDLEQLFNDN